MSKPSTALVRRPPGAHALARIEVDRGVRFTAEPAHRLAAAGILLAALLGPVLGSGVALPAMTTMAALPVPYWLLLRRLRRALEARHRGTPEQVVAMLRSLARSSRLVPSSVRAAAAGSLALELLEQGELEPALEVLRDPMFEKRRRPGDFAAIAGEGIRALIGRLFPAAGWPVLPSDALCHDTHKHAAQIQLVVIRAALRLLEAVETEDAGRVATRWAELPIDELAEMPVLATLLQAEAARVQPALARDLDARIEALSPAGRRLVLQHPAVVAALGDGARGYRSPGRAPAEWSTRLAVPKQLGTVRLFGLGRSEVVLFVVVVGPLTGVANLFIGMAATIGVILGLGVLTYFTGLTRPLARRDRVEPMVAAGMPRSTWLRELSHMRTRSHAFDRDEVMLVLGVHRAEQALLAGDRAGALESIGWWLGNLSHRGLHELDLLGLGAALLRLATLLGFDEAMTLLERVPPGTRRGVRRSGHGDAPRAMALARALVAARRGDWPAAARCVKEALDHPPVRLEDFDQAVHGRLLRLLAKRGHRFSRAALGLPRERHPGEANLVRALKRPAMMSPEAASR